MATKREAKRQALKDRLIEAATNRIADQGLANFRARDVAADAGCALGSVYTAFADLDDLILRVNAGTLQRMGQGLAQATADCSPRDALRTLARGYASFARDNRNLWDALFDHRLAESVPVPDWLLAEHSKLLQEVIAPLSALRPNLTDVALQMRARTYFAAVHGIVSISLQKRFLGVPDDRLDLELDSFVYELIDGVVGKVSA